MRHLLLPFKACDCRVVLCCVLSCATAVGGLQFVHLALILSGVPLIGKPGCTVLVQGQDAKAEGRGLPLTGVVC